MQPIYKISTLMIAIILLLGLLLPFGAQAAPLKVTKVVTIDGNSAGRIFDGIGMVNSSGTSKLLQDYPANQRSDILDYLFKPNFGAGLTIVKNEIGADINSSSGTEPSHHRLEADTPVARGVNFWISQEAKNRNAAMRFAAGRWGIPSWAGPSDTKKKDYYISLLNVMAANGTPIDYLSPETNEGSFSRDYVVNVLKPAMNAAGHSNVKLVAQDAYNSWGIADTIMTDTALKNILAAINNHYVTTSSANAINAGLPLFNDEADTPMRERWSRLMFVAVNNAKQYVEGKMVRVMYQPALDSVYDSIKYNSKGLLTANTPWSGHYEVHASLWMTAHFTQFVKPGWKFLDSGSGSVDGNHYYLALREPSTSNYSVIIINNTNTPVDYTFNITGGLSSGPVHVWRTTQTEQFIQQPDVTPADGSFAITIPAQSIYSLTTTTGQRKGTPAFSIPADSAFGLPYNEDFSAYAVGQQPKHSYDQAGAFEVADLAGSKVLKQTITVAPWGWSGGPANPYTLIGDMRWLNYQVSADVLLGSSGFAYLAGRNNLNDRDGGGAASGYQLHLATTGAWNLNKIVFGTTTNLATGTLPGFNAAAWHNLRVRMNGASISAFIDGMQVASITDGALPSGQVALGSSLNTVHFDNLKVEAIDANTPTSVVRVNDKDSAIFYSGNGVWFGEDENWMDYARSTQKSSTAGSYFEYTFNGTGVALIGRKTGSGGLADVFIDGVLQGQVNTNSGTTVHRAPLYQKTGLAAGSHTIRVVIVSNFFQLDVIEYTTTGGGPAPATPTRTNTPVISPTVTLMPAITNTPTLTRTNTSGPSPTRTRTPTVGPSATRTPTSIVLPTVTSTQTVGIPTNTATRTSTPTTGPTVTQSVGACSPVTSTITIPFIFDGAGAFCWQASSLGGFINSWNTTSVSLNGMNVTNIWVGSGSYPAKIGGFYYVSYNSAVAWGHFEAKP